MDILSRVSAKCETWPSLQELAAATVYLLPNWKAMTLSKRLILVEYYMQHRERMVKILGPAYFRSASAAITRQNTLAYIQKAGHPVHHIPVAGWTRLEIIKDTAKLVGIV